MLKRYYEREKVGGTEAVGSVVGIAVIDDSDIDVDDLGKGKLVETSSVKTDARPKSHVSEELSAEQVSQVNELLEEYEDVLSDMPGCTNLGEHDIKLTTDQPILSRQYPISFSTQETIKDEVRSMLDFGVIEPSDSEYGSNIVIVKKLDGSNRFCIYFKAINRHTVFDCEPIPNMEDIFY